MSYVLGKRKMNSIMAHETAISYRDVAVYGVYMVVGNTERLVIGSYELINEIVTGAIKIYEPDFSEDEPKYISRRIELKRSGEECTYQNFGAE